MQLGLPVIAVNSGGPTETIKHGDTGFLAVQVIYFFLIPHVNEITFFSYLKNGEDFAKYMNILTTGNILPSFVLPSLHLLTTIYNTSFDS
jgi:hypothetical protein